MTKDRKAKDAARALSSETRASYVAARRAEGGRTSHSLGIDDGWDDLAPPSLAETIAGSPLAACDRMEGDRIWARGARGSGGISIPIDLPPGAGEPTVHVFVMDDTTTDIQVQEEFDGGTLACGITTNGTLTVEVVMSDAEAKAAVGRGEVRLADPDFDENVSAVHFDVDVEVSFTAIVNPEYGGVESFDLEGVELI